MATTIFSRDDLDLIVEFAGCSLDEKPGSNWVQGAGGLPDYICRIARAIKRSGKSTSQAIAIAVSRVKKWAAGGDNVDADTRAKAAKALAEWERLKAKSKSKSKAKHALAASHRDGDGHPAVLCLAKADYNVDIVRAAWETRQRAARKAYWAANPAGRYEDAPSSMWVKEQWTSHLIVSSDYGSDRKLYKVPYTVDTQDNVTFSEPVQVKTQYVTVDDTEVDGNEITDADLQKMMATVGPCPKLPDHLLLLSIGPRPQRSALDEVIAASRTVH